MPDINFPTDPNLHESRILDRLIDYIADELLEGRRVGLDAQTPLLEWGILNSLEIRRLLAFIATEFGVELEAKNLAPSTFENLGHLSQAVERGADTRAE